MAREKNLLRREVWFALVGGIALLLFGCDIYTMPSDRLPRATTPGGIRVENAHLMRGDEESALHYIDITWDREQGCMGKALTSDNMEVRIEESRGQSFTTGHDLIYYGNGTRLVFGYYDYPPMDIVHVGPDMKALPHEFDERIAWLAYPKTRHMDYQERHKWMRDTKRKHGCK